MAYDAIRLVRKGERPRAKTINDIIKALNNAGILDSAGISKNTYQHYCAGYNSEQDDLKPYDVVTIKDEQQSRAIYQPNRLLKIGLASGDDNLEAFAICLDRIPAGKCGRICISGLAWCLTDGGTGKLGTLEAGHLYLTLGSSGPAQVISISGPYALVRFPCGTSGVSTLENHIHRATIIGASD